MTLYLTLDARAARGEAQRKSDNRRRSLRQAGVFTSQRWIEHIEEQHAAFLRANPSDSGTVRSVRLDCRTVPCGIGVESPAGLCQRRHPSRLVQVDRLVARRHEAADGIAVRIPSVGRALQHSDGHPVTKRVHPSFTAARADKGDTPADQLPFGDERADELRQKDAVDLVRLPMAAIAGKKIDHVIRGNAIPQMASLPDMFRAVALPTWGRIPARRASRGIALPRRDFLAGSPPRDGR